MEPLTTAVMALATILATKALEKTGENVGSLLCEKSSQFLSFLRKQSPDTVDAIEKSEQPLDYGEAVLEIESAAKRNDEVAQLMQELVALSDENSPPNFTQFLRQIEESVKKSQHKYPENFIQNIQKAINVGQTQNIDQRGSTFNI